LFVGGGEAPASELGILIRHDARRRSGPGRNATREVARLAPDAIRARCCPFPRGGYAFVGLHLHPALPDFRTYEIAAGCDASREMRRHLGNEGVRVHDIEFVTVDADCAARWLVPALGSAAERGATRLNVSGDASDRSRLVERCVEPCDLDLGFGAGFDPERMARR
jgi:hypothetical protein